MENNESFASPKEETKKHCSTHCDWPNCTLEGCVTKPQVKKRYACRLDEQECLETCHGNRENKEKCSFCTVTETPASKEKPDFEKMAIEYWEGICEDHPTSEEQAVTDAYQEGANDVWKDHVEPAKAWSEKQNAFIEKLSQENESQREQIAALQEEIRQLKKQDKPCRHFTNASCNSKCSDAYCQAVGIKTEEFKLKEVKRIRITKLKEVDNPVHPRNISEGFTLDGEYIAPPTIGERFYVGRSWSTSLVQEIINPNTFRTFNSIYRFDPID